MDPQIVIIVVEAKNDSTWNVILAGTGTKLGVVFYDQELGYVPNPPGEWGLPSLHDAAQHIAMSAIKIYFERRQTRGG